MNPPAPPTVQTKFRIEAMDCPTEEGLIRGKLSLMVGIAALEFNLIQRILTVTHSLDSPAPIVTAIRQLGFEAVPALDGAVPGPKTGAASLATWLPLVLAGALALGSEFAEWFGLLSPWLPAGLALAAVALGGIKTFHKGWIAVINRNFNINALMSIAVTGALFLRQWPEAAMVMVLFALAEKIEAFSLDRARRALTDLLALSPDQATVQEADGGWTTLPAAGVATGSLVRASPGQRISHDGTIVRGSSSIDQSAITGESLPVDRGVGDPVFAGTVNHQGELVFRVDAMADSSTLARIIRQVEEAQSRRSATQRFVDRFARIYTPAVMALALLVAVLPPLLLGGDWADWIYKALVLLIIACPCALVISTPVTIVSALAAAARHGIIVKGGVWLEAAARLAWVAFDKTGTITSGNPVQTDCILLSADSGLQDIAASLARRSDHPVSQAIALAHDPGKPDRFQVGDFTALPGRGVSGVVNGEIHYLGNHRLIEDLGICSPELEARLLALEAQGKTTVMLASRDRPLLLFAVADSIKPTSREAVASLHRLGLKTLMLSGDNERTVQSIAAQAGIDQATGDLLPEDKARAILALKWSGGPVAMTGDGINDAPALATADMGIAMGGSGSHSAIETADVVLMDDDLRKIPLLITLSRRTRRILAQNISIALGIKLVFLALTLLGMGTMWMAVFADMGASLIVVANGLRMRRK